MGNEAMNFQGNVWGVIIAVLMIGNTVLTMWSSRKVSKEVSAVHDDVKDVHKVINSQLTAERIARTEQETKLVAATQKSAFLEGAASEKK